MPFSSNAQKKWMYANKPDIAKEFQAETPDNKSLPEYVSTARKQAIENRKRG